MKFFILATVAIIMHSSYAIGRESGAEDQRQCAGIFSARSGELDVDAVKLAMGPTSAPHKPGGTGTASEGQQSPAPSVNKKSRRRHKKS